LCDSIISLNEADSIVLTQYVNDHAALRMRRCGGHRIYDR
jgi:hypothetical protein